MGTGLQGNEGHVASSINCFIFLFGVTNKNVKRNRNALENINSDIKSSKLINASQSVFYVSTNK